jgi:SAM-dependent methyltransferase
LGRERLAPGREHPDYLVLCHRREALRRCLDALPITPIRVLDVGGRIQPYRPLVADRLAMYVALDPQFSALVDVVGVGEFLPFRSASFDVVLSTQVLGYATDPWGFASELHRVLVPGGGLFLSAPSLHPTHHDERWRFLPDGLRILLRAFDCVEIHPEGNSLSGFFRTVATIIDDLARPRRPWRPAAQMVIRVVNTVGAWCDRWSGGSEAFTTNYSVWARKRP